MHVSGRTTVYPIVGDPIAQVRTPALMNAHFERTGADGLVVPFRVTKGSLASVFGALREVDTVGGVIVTVPHKVAAFALCDDAEDHSRRSGTVNVVRFDADGRAVGAMFDGVGFLAGLADAGHRIVGRRVLLVGAGGAASAIAFAFAAAGVGELVIANRTADRAHALAERVRDAFPGVPVTVGRASATGHELVVNATSLGMRPDDALPLDLDGADGDTVVAEVVMNPDRTRLLRSAEALGCRTHGGRSMIDPQIRLMAEFLGIAGPERTA